MRIYYINFYCSANNIFNHLLLFKLFFHEKITESYLLYLNRSPLFNNKIMKFKFSNNINEDENINSDGNKKKKK